MTCPGCAVEVTNDAQLCPRCGEPLRHRRSSVQLDFDGTAMQLLGWIGISLAATLVVVPLAWVQAATMRWLCRNLKLSDGTTATFQGTGGQIVGWMILYVITVIGYQILNPRAAEAGVGYSLLLLIVYVLVLSGIGLKLIGWFVSNVVFASGPGLSFSGTYAQLLGWNLLIWISCFSIIGWAWAIAAMCRWYARNTQGQAVEFQFHGQGHQILWRILVFALVCLLIIPIPWMMLWLMRWFVQNISFARSVGAVAVV